MTPVKQTIVDDIKGDCLRACVCSLLGLAIDQVPNFAELDFFTGLDSWLAARGLRFLRIGFNFGSDAVDIRRIWFGFPGTERNPAHMLLWGHSPRLIRGEPRHLASRPSDRRGKSGPSWNRDDCYRR